MSDSAGRQMVIVSMVLVAAVVGYTLVRGELKTPSVGTAFRTVWAIAVLFLLLAILADTVPAIAGPFAGLVALAVLVGRSSSVNQIVNVIPSPKGNL